MSMSVKHYPADKKTGMTMLELAIFCHQVTATMPIEDAKAKVTIGFRGQITSIEATA